MHAPKSIPAAPYSDDYKNQALGMLKAGSSLRDVANQLGVSIPSLVAWKKKADGGGREPKGRPRKRRAYTDAFKKKALHLVKGGLSVNQVAKSIGVSPPTLYRWEYSAEAAEQAHQRAERPPTLGGKELKKKVIRLIKYGRSPAQVAALMQIEEALIRQWLQGEDRLVHLSAKAETSTRNGYDEATKEAVLQQIRQGISIYRIAKTSGITAITIRKWKQQAQAQAAPLNRARERHYLTEQLSRLEQERDALISALSLLLQTYY